jgi:hypothetical protein
MGKLQTQKELEDIVKKYRRRLGIDPTYSIQVIVPTKSQIPKRCRINDAWIQQSSTHPYYYLFIPRASLVKWKDHPGCITRLIVHELLHIVIGESFLKVNKRYDYRKDGLVEETLVARMAKAIVRLPDEAQYEAGGVQ